MSKTNEILKETLLLNGFDYVDNNNILFSNLAKDGLHINEGECVNLQVMLVDILGTVRGVRDLVLLKQKIKIRFPELRKV